MGEITKGYIRKNVLALHFLYQSYIKSELSRVEKVKNEFIVNLYLGYPFLDI